MFEIIAQAVLSVFIFIASMVHVNADTKCSAAINGDPSEHYCWDNIKEELRIVHASPVKREVEFSYDEPLEIFGRVDRSAQAYGVKFEAPPTTSQKSQSGSSIPTPDPIIETVSFDIPEQFNPHQANSFSYSRPGHEYASAFSRDYLGAFSPQSGGGSRHAFSGSARDFNAWSSLARLEQRTRAYTQQKSIWISRFIGRTNGELTPQQAQDKKLEDDQIIPCLLARLENRPGGEKCDTNWGILTDDKGLVMSWEWDFPKLNNRRPYDFSSKPNDFIGSWVRDAYNYALNLNMQAFNNHNFEDLNSSTLAIDFVEYADKSSNLLWLGFAEHLVDFRTGRFQAKGYDKETLDPNVAQHFELSIEEPTLINFELTRVLNGFSKHVPHSKDDVKALADSELSQAVLLATLMALSEAEEKNWSAAYAFIAHLYAIKNFVDAAGDGFAKGMLENFNVWGMFEGFSALGLMGVNLLEDIFDPTLEGPPRMANFFVVLFNSSPEIFSTVWDFVKKEVETNPKFDLGVKNAGLHGFYAGMIASLFANPLKGVSKFGPLFQKGQKGRDALEDLAKRIAKRLAKNPELAKPLGLGSTANLAKGSTRARNLREKLAIEEVERNPLIGIEIDVRMTDPRWPGTAGWQKRQYVSRPGGESIEVHYLYNAHTKQIDDFKIIAQNLRSKR